MLEHAQLTRRVLGIHAEVDALQTLSSEYPENAQVLAALAEALVDNNQLDLAVQAAQKALQSNLGKLVYKQLHRKEQLQF